MWGAASSRRRDHIRWCESNHTTQSSFKHLDDVAAVQAAREFQACEPLAPIAITGLIRHGVQLFSRACQKVLVQEILAFLYEFYAHLYDIPPSFPGRCIPLCGKRTSLGKLPISNNTFAPDENNPYTIYILLYSYYYHMAVLTIITKYY